MGWVKGSEKQLSGPSDKPVFPRVKQLSSHASPCEVRPVFPSVRPLFSWLRLCTLHSNDHLLQLLSSPCSGRSSGQTQVEADCS